MRPTIPLPKQIAIAKKTPGIYLIREASGFGLLKIDAEGRVFQLNRDFEPEGFLSDDGWFHDSFTLFRLEKIECPTNATLQ